MNKWLRKDDVINTPFVATKEWELSNVTNEDLVLTEAGNPVAVEFIAYGSGDGVPELNTSCNVAKEQQEDDRATYREGQKGSGIFYPETELTNADGTYKRVVYDQIKGVFYNNYRDPTKIWGMEYVDFEKSKTKRFLADSLRLFDIPRIVFGEKITENTVVVTDNSLDDTYTITDDGYCNLIAGNNIFSRFQEVDYGENIFVSGSDPYCDDYLYPWEPSGSISLSAAIYNTESAFVFWSDNITHEDGFVVLRSDDTGSTWVTLALVGVNVTGTFDNTVAITGMYWYEVYAYNTYGTSSHSNTASVHIWDPPIGETRLTASIPSGSLTQSYLNWNDSISNEHTWVIERSIDSGSTWSELQTLSADITESYDDTIVTASWFWYRVYAFNDFSSSNRSNTASVFNWYPPAAPTDLSSSYEEHSPATVSLTWTDNSNNELGFRLERSNDSASTYPVSVSLAADVTSYLDTNVFVVGGTTYWYRVQSFNAYTSSTWSEISQVVYNPPIAPSGLTGDLWSDSASAVVSLSWVDNSTFEHSFSMERSNDSGSSFTQIDTYGANITASSDINVVVAGGTTYWYRVAAFNLYGTSSWSNVYTRSVCVVPNDPSDLSGSVSSDSSSAQVYLTWIDNSSNELGFSLERSNDSGSTFTQLDHFGVGVESYTDTSSFAVGGTTFWYRISAYNIFGTSSWSNVLTQSVFVPPATPSDLSGSLTQNTASAQLSLSWVDNSWNEIGFYMERSNDSGSTWDTSSAFAKDTTEAIDTSISFSGGTAYWYRIASWNAFATSSWSNVLTQSVWNPPDVPTGLSASLTDHPTTPYVTLTWTDTSTSEDGFRIERSNDSGSTYVSLSAVGPDVQTYVDSNVLVLGGMTYWYKVQSYNIYTSSAWSNVVEQTVYLPPVAPSSLTASYSEPSSSYLNWVDNSDNEDGFFIERAPGTSSAFVLIMTASADVTGTYDDTTAIGETYNYRVAAYNIYDTSSYSNSSSVVIAVDYLYDESGSKYLVGPYDSFEGYRTVGMFPTNRGYGWSGSWEIMQGKAGWFAIEIAEDDLDDAVSGVISTGSNTGYGWLGGFEPETSPPSMSVLFSG